MKRACLLWTCLILSLLSPPLLQAQNRSAESEIIFRDLSGNIDSLPDSLEQKFSSSELKQDDPQTAVDSENLLYSWLNNRGYLDGIVLNVASDSVLIKSGCRYEVKSVNINSTIDYDIVDVLKNQPLDISKAGVVLRQIIRDYRRAGYYYATGDFNIQPVRGECEAGLVFTINKGEQVRTSAIRFTGNDRSEAALLRDIAGFRKGEVLSPQQADLYAGRLRASDYIESVEGYRVFQDSAGAVLVYAVSDRNRNSLDGILGFVPNQNGQGELVGKLDLNLWHVLSSGNGLQLYFERIPGDRSRLDFSARQDWFQSLPLSLEAGFSFYQNDSTYQSRELRLGAAWYLSELLSVTGEAGLGSVTAGTIAIQTGMETDSDNKYAGLGFRYRSVDNPVIPRKGSELEVKYRVIDKMLKEDKRGSEVQQSLMASFSGYLSAGSNSVIVPSLHAYYLEAERPGLSDLIRFGGAASLRGFSEDRFRAGRMLWGDIEYRFLANRSSWFFVFIAAGSYNRPPVYPETDNSFNIKENLYSAGFGLSYRTRIGRLNFSYALNSQEGPGYGKVHVGIKTVL